jgi:hypothetical protein
MAQVALGKRVRTVWIQRLRVLLAERFVDLL